MAGLFWAPAVEITCPPQAYTAAKNRYSLGTDIQAHQDRLVDILTPYAHLPIKKLDQECVFSQNMWHYGLCNLRARRYFLPLQYKNGPYTPERVAPDFIRCTCKLPYGDLAW